MDDNTRSVLVLALTSLTTGGIAWMKTRETRKYLEALHKAENREGKGSTTSTSDATDQAKQMLDGAEDL